MKNAEKYYGKKIANATFADDKIQLHFADNTNIIISDNGQECCEYRYIKTDDDVSWLDGKILTKIETKDAPNIVDSFDIVDDFKVHEVQFLEIMTNEGCITFASHNEHNGYYCGFSIIIEEGE